MIDTLRLRLRRLGRQDLEPIVRMFADPEVMRYSVTGVRTREESSLWLERSIAVYDNRGFGFLATTDRSSGEYLGHVGLLPQEVDGRKEVEIGYWIRREFWQKGIATEAALACRDYGFDSLDRERLISIIVPENFGSRRVAEKVGMRLEKETVWKNVEVCVYAMRRTLRDG